MSSPTFDHSSSTCTTTCWLDLALRLERPNQRGDLGSPLVTPMAHALLAGVGDRRGPRRIAPRGLPRLYGEHRIVASPSGSFHLSADLYNTSQHVERALAAPKPLRPLIMV